MSRLAFLIAVAVGTYVVAQSGAPPGEDHGATPLYRLDERQLDRYLRFLDGQELDPVARLARLAKQGEGQPYEPNLLGEGLAHGAGAGPLYVLDRSDTVSFVEQSLAMAVSPDFTSFFVVLQRLRYADGEISTTRRNHNLLSDWSVQNQWLLEDITPKLAEGIAWVPLHQIVRKRAFLAERFGLQTTIPDQKFIDGFIPRVYLRKVLPELRAGDIALVITGNDREQFCQELGILLVDPGDTERPLRMAQSAEPEVRTEVFLRAVWLRKEILGFKFLRLRPDAEARAAAEVERLSPVISPPEIP